MTFTTLGRPAGAALSLLLAATAVPGHADTLQVASRDTNLANIPFAERSEICLRWSHSVTGGAVADCFENRAGTLTLTRSYLHDFAAGLGEIAGRGIMTADPDGGYWITGIDEALPRNALVLRVGPAPVNHRIDHPGGTLNLTDIAANQRVTLTLIPDQDSP